ncbi:MAG TPA: hypothetical protein VMX57_03120, partial [Planctomycetota bacterium]|nr:hypothetical protein [Planctomycetota bacterium]
MTRRTDNTRRPACFALAVTLACVVVALALAGLAARANAQTPPVPLPEPEKPPPTVFAGVFVPLTTVTPVGVTVTRAAPDVIRRLFKDDEKLVDVSAVFRAGKLDFGDAKVLIIDAPALADDEGRLAKILADGKRLVEDFVTAGGVLVVFTGNVADVQLDFLPGKLAAGLLSQDHDRRVAVDPTHPLLGDPQKLTARDLGSVKGRLYPGGCYGYYEGLAPVVAYDRLGRCPVVLEASAGKGRVLLVHLSPVEALALGDADDKRAGERLLENLLDYIRRVLKGDVPPVKPFGRRLTLTVFEDVNADGRRDADEKPVANMLVGWTFSRTDAAGRVELDLDVYTRFVQLDADLATYRLPFWKRIPDDAKALEIGLVPREKPFGDLTRIAYIADTGPVPADDDEALRFMLDEIARVEPRVNLLVVVADSAEDVRPRYDALRKINPPFEVVYYPIHNLQMVPIAESDRWEDTCGPGFSRFGFCRLYGEDVALDWFLRFSEERLDVLRFRRGGLRTPPTFALIDVPREGDEPHEADADDEEPGLFTGVRYPLRFESELRVAGLRELLAPLHPAVEAPVPPGDLNLSVALGDTALGPDVPLKIELAHIRPKGERLELVDLKPETQPLYRATSFTRTLALTSLDKLAPGFYALKYTAGVPGSRTWRRTVSFVVPEQAPAEVTLGRPWLATGGNSFHTGAAVETIEPPLVLTRVTTVGGPVFDGSPVVTADGVS